MISSSNIGMIIIEVMALVLCGTGAFIGLPPALAIRSGRLDVFEERMALRDKTLGQFIFGLGVVGAVLGVWGT